MPKTAVDRAPPRRSGGEAAAGLPAAGSRQGLAPPVADAVRAPGPGSPLPAAVSGRLARGLGVDISGVRVHADAASHAATDALSVRAFAYGRDVYLARGESATDLPLMAHEVAHVVQQQAGGPAVQLFTSSPGDSALEREAQRAGDAVSRGERATVTGRSGVARVQGQQRPWYERAGAWVGERATAAGQWAGEQVERGVAWVESQAWDLLGRHAPDLVPILRQGIVEWLKERLAETLRPVVSVLVDPVREAAGGVAEELQSRFGQLAAWMRRARAQLIQRTCTAVAGAAEDVERAVQGVLEAEEKVLRRLKRLARRAGAALRRLFDRFAAPVIDWLRGVALDVWERIQRLARRVWDATLPIRTGFRRAWTWIKNRLGMGEGPEGRDGLAQWMQRKAEAAWTWIKERVEPIKRPLLVLGGVMLALSPAGPVVAAGAAGAGLVTGVRWLWRNLREPEAFARARQWLSGTALPALMAATRSVSRTVRAAARTVGGLMAQARDWVGSLVASIAGPLLAPIARDVAWLAGRVRALATWALDHLRDFAEWVGSGLDRLLEWAKPVLDVLKQVIAVLALPLGIPAMLAGVGWRLLPQCLKGPLIRLVLTALSGLLKLMPATALGPLGVMIREFLVGFLDKARARETLDRQVAIADRFAVMFTENLWDFFVGYVIGLVKGLWSGLTGPFVLLWDIAKLIGGAIRWLWNLATSVTSASFRNLITGLRSAWSAIQADLWPAVQGFFAGPFDPMRIFAWIRGVLDQLADAARGAGAWLFDRLVAFLRKPARQLGESIGELAGNILFDVLLTVLTAGGYAAKPVVQRLARWATQLVGRAAEFVTELAAQFPRIMRFLRGAAEFARTNPALKRVIGAVEWVLEKLLAYFRMSYGVAGAGERATAAGERAVVAGERAAATGERAVVTGERAATAAERAAVTGERRLTAAERGIESGADDLVRAEQRMAAEQAGRTVGESAFNQSLREVRELFDRFVRKLRGLAEDVLDGLGFRRFAVRVEGEWVELVGIRSEITLIRYRLRAAVIRRKLSNPSEIIVDLRRARAQVLGRARAAVARGEEALAVTLRSGRGARLAESIGEEAAHALVRHQFPGAARIWRGTGSGTLDLVYRLPNGSILVVEAKGGAGRIGSALVGGGEAAQQGTIAYLRETLSKMVERGGREAKAANEVLAALNQRNIRYAVARTPIPAGNKPLETTFRDFLVPR